MINPLIDPEGLLGNIGMLRKKNKKKVCFISDALYYKSAKLSFVKKSILIV